MTELQRAQRLIQTSNQLKRRYAFVALTAPVMNSGHASTGGVFKGVYVKINSDWSKNQTDGRLKATLYHESVHVKQRRRKGFLGDSTKAIREFHAHTEELRKAIKHDLYSDKEKQSKLKKIKKYHGLIVGEGNDFTLFAEQYQRIENGLKPKKITTKKLYKAMKKANA